MSSSSGLPATGADPPATDTAPFSMVTGAPSTADAYRECERLTRAGTDNFYYGIRLLSRRKRWAMCAVYAFARRVEDIGDGPLEVQEKLHRLEDVQGGLGALREGAPLGEDPVMLALADAHTRFDLPLDALNDLIAGVRMDVAGTT